MTPAHEFEHVPDPAAEAAQIREIADLTVELLDMRYGDGPILRGVHPKSHGCVRAIFEVRPDVPEALRVGLFARPGARHDAWVRYSNASVRVAHDLEDGKHGSRGMAVKVLDVEGEVLHRDGRRASQDFLMINQRAFAFANVADYLRLTRIIRRHDDDATPFFAPLQSPSEEFGPEEMARILQTFKAVQTLQSVPVENPLEVSYFGAAPFLFGPDRVMHFSAEPWSGEKPQSVSEDAPESYLAEALAHRMRSKEDVVFDFKVQVRGPDDGDLGIENAHTVWDEVETPSVPVARIVVPAPQRKVHSRRREARCERLFFTPWHCLAEHRPLGGINRLREAVYLASARHRKGGKLSARQELT